MKKLLLIALLAAQLFAVSSLSTIGESERNLLDAVLKELKLDTLDDAGKEKVFKTFSYGLERDWYAKWNSNDTPSVTKVSDADTQFVDLTLIDENRIYNFTFVYFSKQKQLFVAVKQYISGSAYETKVDKDNYAFYSKKGYMDDNIVYIDGSGGMVVYNSMSVVDL